MVRPSPENGRLRGRSRTPREGSKLVFPAADWKVFTDAVKAGSFELS
jgi:hypothetical protein